MGTAKIIYISIAALTIIPLIAFNIKRFTIRKEGEHPKPNIIRILLVLGGSILLGIFLFTLYKFTLDYQTQLVLERFVRSYSSAVVGEIEYDEFLKQTESICTPDFMSRENRCLSEIEADQKLGTATVSFQLGENILPKYYIEQEFFPDIEGVNKNDTKPIFMISMIDYSGSRKFYISLMHIKGSKWYIDSFDEASEGLVEYSYRYKLIRPEHSNKWYKVN
ncbi:MAG TPA: hypothetical protein GX527_09600 [Clostridiaceae bacterium]|jgi:hypothetical protein|nr:hypothetical protein [Clostridiaceae bacterium]